VSRRLVRWLLLPLACLLALVWLAPALSLRFALPALAKRSGGLIEVSGAAPALPFGASAAHVRVARAGHELALDEFRAVLLPSGPRVDARIANGTLLARGQGLSFRSGFVRAQGVDLESLATVLSIPLSLRGVADGIWRFGPASSVEGSVSRGALSVQGGTKLEVPFAQLVLSAAREPSQPGWDVRWLDIQGPPLSGSATGRLGADGSLDLRIDVRELEEPVLSLFSLLQLPTGPLPLALGLQGTLAAPRLVARDATPEPVTR